MANGTSSSIRKLLNYARTGCWPILVGLACQIAAQKQAFSADHPLPPAPVTYAVSPKPSHFVLAFGSCSRPTLPQPLWPAIERAKPNVWAWLGDIVYADTLDIDFTRSLYAEQARVPAYANFAAHTQIIGTWDDHDYGRNDAGKEYPKRRESQAALLDFLNEPLDSPRRRREGVYASYMFGAEDRLVKVILLDMRYHREAPAEHADTLGSEQWRWLDNELKNSPARIQLLISSFQVLPEDHPSESWSHFPDARKRLLGLIAGSHAPGVVLLSGDRHFAELSSQFEPDIGYPIYELTSSGLTHSYRNVGNEPNRHRVGNLFAELNFGIVSIDWQRTVLTLEARGVDGTAAIHQDLSLSSLRPNQH